MIPYGRCYRARTLVHFYETLTVVSRITLEQEEGFSLLNEVFVLYTLVKRVQEQVQQEQHDVLRQNGLEPGVDVNVDTSVQFALMAGAFTGGTADFTTLFEPTASMVEAEGKGYVLCSIGEESGEIPYTCYYASKKLIAEKPEMIQSFTNAIYKGQQWVATHSAAEIAEAIAPFFPDTSLELLTTVTQRHKDIDAFMSDPILKRESFDRLQTVMEQAGVLPKRADYDAMVNTEFAANAMK